MQKMMTYSEANSVLESSLTPANRCLSKAVAIANDADEDLLADFANARLVPASVVEPGVHWIDEHTIEHYFVDDSGNIIGDGSSLSVSIPNHGEFFIVKTKALLDGSPFPQETYGGSAHSGDDTPDPSVDYFGWVHNEGIISEDGIHIHATLDVYGDRWPNPSAEQEDRSDYGLVNPTSEYRSTGNSPDENGITTFLFHCPLDYSRVNEVGNFHFHILMNDWYANPNKINTPDIVNTWNIAISAKRQSLSYDTTRGLIDFKSKPIDQESADTTLTGFGSGPNDYEVEYVGYYKKRGSLNYNDNKKFTEIIKQDQGTKFKAKRIADCENNSIDLYKIYKKDDSSVFVYFAITANSINS